MRRFDIAVIGSGPGGYRTAVLGALSGLSVAVIERGTWGGCCLNRGCVPKKAWYAAARLVAQADRLPALGIEATLPRADLARAWQHQRRTVESVRSSYVDYLRRLGVAMFEGSAAFVAPDRLVIDDTPAIEAKHVVIATGSHARLPDGWARVPGRVLTTDDLFDAPPPPGRRVGLIGAGVIGTELAFILAMLGCEVVWLARSQPLARRGFTRQALEVLGGALAGHRLAPRIVGAPVRLDVKANEVVIGGDGTPGTAVDWVLVATGRAPHTEGLALDRAGVQVDARGFVTVDAHGGTSVPGVWAIGDVANPRMTSNLALADGAVVVANIRRAGSRRRTPARVPEVVYSAVELARLGMNEDQAEAAGLEPATGFAAFEVDPAALAELDSDGFVRVVADHDQGTLLGAEVVGRDAGSLILIVEQAAGDDHALARLARSAYNHPGRAEAIQNAVESLAARWGLAAKVFGEGAGD